MAVAAVPITPDEIAAAAAVGGAAGTIAGNTISNVLSNILTELIEKKVLKDKKNKGKVAKVEKAISDETNAAQVLHRDNDTIVIELDGKSYIIDISNNGIPDELFDLLRKQKEDKNPDVEIELVQAEGITDEVDTRKSYSAFVSELPKGLNAYYKALFLAVKDVKKFYEKGNKAEGDRAKSNVKPIFGANGNLFCNLYTQDYIPKALEYFVASGGNTTEGRINEFLDLYLKHWESVFFISRGHEWRYYYGPFKNAFATKKPYIALHAIGNSNIETLDKMMAQLKEDNIIPLELGYTPTVLDSITPTGLPKRDIYFYTAEGKADYETFQRI